MTFSEKVILVVKKIPKGEILTYKDIAKRAGNIKAARAIGNILSKNKNPKVPCHRVIKSDFSIGGFQGKKKDSWEKAALLLKEGLIGVIPTDTIYGILGLALNKKVVEKIYRLKKRAPLKPMLILISSQKDLLKFGIKLTPWQKEILANFWPGKISFVLKCPQQKFSYLHRGTKTLAFRMPAKKELLKLLSISGPLIAPSANWEGFAPTKTISEAKKYFGKEVFYLDGGRVEGKPSSLVNISENKLEILRAGAFPIKKYKIRSTKKIF